MAEPLEVRGTGASSGVALGPVYLAGRIEEPLLPRMDTNREHENLAKAIALSIDGLESLGRQCGPESAAILDFQVEVLCDPEILEETAKQIDAGDSAVFAWVRTLDDYIDNLEEADDEHARARAADIVDIKNRVLAALAGRPLTDFPAGSIFVGKDMEPSRLLSHDWSRGGGIVLFNGSLASHVAMLARAKSVPMVIATGRLGIVCLSTAIPARSSCARRASI
jgi:phosphoenolpyruvate-protein phosphotransferase (PTS system enzyme I)